MLVRDGLLTVNRCRKSQPLVGSTSAWFGAWNYASKKDYPISKQTAWLSSFPSALDGGCDQLSQAPASVTFPAMMDCNLDT